MSEAVRHWWSPRFWQDVVQPSDAWWRVPPAWRPAVGSGGDVNSRSAVATLWREHAGVAAPPLFDVRWRRWLSRLPARWREFVEVDLQPTHVFLGPGWDWGWPFTWDDGVIVWPGSPAYWATKSETSTVEVFVHEVCHLWQRTTEDTLVSVYRERGQREGFRPATESSLSPASWHGRVRNPDGLDLWEFDVPEALGSRVIWGYWYQPSMQQLQLVDLITRAPQAAALAVGRQRFGTTQLDHPHEFTMPGLVRSFGRP